MCGRRQRLRLLLNRLLPHRHQHVRRMHRLLELLGQPDPLAASAARMRSACTTSSVAPLSETSALASSSAPTFSSSMA